MKRFERFTRRKALGGLAGVAATAPLLPAQQDPFRDHSRVPGMDELRTIQEFEAVAYAKLPREVYTYTAYGSEGEFTLRRNREAFDWVELVPRGVVDVSSVNTATALFGIEMAFPIFVSPSASHSALHPSGEAGTHQGASAASNTPMLISNNASMPVEKIAAGGSSPIGWQLYPRQDLEVTKQLIDTAMASHAKVLIMTVDQQASYYERSVHDRHLTAGRGGGGRGGAGAGRGGAAGVATTGGRASAGAATATSNAPRAATYRVPEGRLWYNWKYAEQVKAMLNVPMLAKGILTGEDAKLCLEHGFDGIYVSNHGGRSLDYGPSTIEVLAEIVDAVGGRVPVLFDSGIRSGSDILKALALGAKAVCLGRSIRWGLAAYGPPGVTRVLEILQAELIQAMAETGRPTLASIDRSLVRMNFR